MSSSILLTLQRHCADNVRCYLILVLSWLCSQADKQLDIALKHAEQAIALSPRNAGHVDTLAEVHFRRGDAAKAVELEERAIAMDPENESLREQLKRFRGIQ